MEAATGNMAIATALAGGLLLVAALWAALAFRRRAQKAEAELTR